MQLRVTFASLPGPKLGPRHRGSSRSRRVRSLDIAAATLGQQSGSYGGKKRRPNSGSQFSDAGRTRRPEKERDLGKLNTQHGSWTRRHLPRQWEREPDRGRGPRRDPANDGKGPTSGAGSREKLSQCNGETPQRVWDSAELRRLVGEGRGLFSGAWRPGSKGGAWVDPNLLQLRSQIEGASAGLVRSRANGCRGEGGGCGYWGQRVGSGVEQSCSWRPRPRDGAARGRAAGRTRRPSSLTGTW